MILFFFYFTFEVRAIKFAQPTLCQPKRRISVVCRKSIVESSFGYRLLALWKKLWSLWSANNEASNEKRLWSRELTFLVWQTKPRDRSCKRPAPKSTVTLVFEFAVYHFKWCEPFVCLLPVRHLGSLAWQFLTTWMTTRAKGLLISEVVGPLCISRDLAYLWPTKRSGMCDHVSSSFCLAPRIVNVWHQNQLSRVSLNSRSTCCG